VKTDTNSAKSLRSFIPVLETVSGDQEPRIQLASGIRSVQSIVDLYFLNIIPSILGNRQPNACCTSKSAIQL
jgi:hypothetical protein